MGFTYTISKTLVNKELFISGSTADVTGKRTILEVVNDGDCYVEPQKEASGSWTAVLSPYRVNATTVIKNLKDTVLDVLRVSMASNESSGSHTIVFRIRAKIQSINVSKRDLFVTIT